MDPLPLTETLDNATRALLDARNAAGHWEGELSSSALSTATATFTLHLYTQTRPHAPRIAEAHQLISAGLQWLAANQNEDGGWGDTTLSFSNISTTTLCWAALAPFEAQHAATVQRAEAWLMKHAGSLRPDDLAAAIIARYGKDKTFSVPILTMATLAGRTEWRHVPQLPFELAALPHQLWTTIKLPVVSYALPALIAIGQVRHAHRPTRNPFTRALRHITSSRTLDTLRDIQPAGGGYLEATPLTSFVTMSLLACDTTPQGEQVIAEGINFLLRSARPDGAWPIDTNLATWVTTLSVNALAHHPDFATLLPPDERKLIVNWLLNQQYRVEHPYTHAAPGGWAWTDLPGGVPDADDTAGALVALYNLNHDRAEVRDAASRGVTWLLNLQNRDGGIPTFCKGWGSLPFDRSGSDLTAHALAAWADWCGRLPRPLADRTIAAKHRAYDYLARMQRNDGSWVPLWFGNQHGPDEENPIYGTARVILGMEGLIQNGKDKVLTPAARNYLHTAQNADGGWGGGSSSPSSLEETALAVQGLCVAYGRAHPSIHRAVQWLTHHSDNGRHFPPSPIGFYFAKLWYYESLYPLIFTVGGLARAAAVQART